jgi:hypothetical protein
LHAKRGIRQSDVFALLDYVAYFDLTGIVQPDTQSKMTHFLAEAKERMARRKPMLPPAGKSIPDNKTDD